MIRICKTFLIFLIFFMNTVPTYAGAVYTQDTMKKMNGIWMMDAKHPQGTGNATSNVYIDPATGQLTHQAVDFHLPGKDGLDLVFGRVYQTSEASSFKRVLKKDFEKRYMWVEDSSYYFTLLINGNLTKHGPFRTSEEACETLDNIVRRENMKGNEVKLDNWDERNGRIEEYSEICTRVELNQKRTELGVGWQWMLPSIEPSPEKTEEPYHYFLDEKRTPYLIEWREDGTEGKLVGHPENENYRVVRQSWEDSRWRVKDQAGTEVAFSSKGKPEAKSDRYGNHIKYHHDPYTGELLAIQDTMNRTLRLLKGNNELHAELSHPDSENKLVYRYQFIPILQRAYQARERIEGRTHLLNQVIDPMGRPVYYDYQTMNVWYSACGGCEIDDLDDENNGWFPYVLLRSIKENNLLHHQFWYTPKYIQRWGLGSEQIHLIDRHQIHEGPCVKYHYIGKNTREIPWELGCRVESPFGSVTTMYDSQNKTISTFHKPKKGESKSEKILAHDGHKPSHIETAWINGEKERVLESKISYSKENGRETQSCVDIPKQIEADDKKYYTRACFYDAAFGNISRRAWCTKEKKLMLEEYVYDNKGRLTNSVNALPLKEEDPLCGVSHNEMMYSYEENLEAHVHTQVKKINEEKSQITKTYYPKKYHYALPDRVEIAYTHATKGTQQETTKYVHDVLTGNMTAKVDPDGYVTTWKYDLAGRVVEENYNGGELVDKYTYIGDHIVRLHRVWERAGKRKEKNREWVHDRFGNLIRFGKPGYSPIYQARYNDLQQLVWASDAEGNAYECEYDSYGEALKLKNSDGSSWETEIDRVGQTATTFQRSGQNAAEKRFVSVKKYDGFNRVIENVQGSKKETWTYTLYHPEPTTYTDGLGRTTSYDYTAYRDLCSVIEPDKTQTFYGYHPLEKLEEITTLSLKLPGLYGYKAHKKYDETGFMASEEWENGDTETYERNAAGSVIKNEDPSFQQRVEYTYYPNQMIKGVKGYHKDEVMIQAEKEYEQLDRPTVERGEADGKKYQLTTSYDDWDHIALQTFYQNKRVWQVKSKQTHDGRLEEVTLSDGTKIKYNYLYHRIRTIEVTLPSGETKVFAYRYDGFGQQTELCCHASSPIYRSQRYDAYGRLTELVTQLGIDDQQTFKETSRYDAYDNLVETQVKDGVKTTYAYDERNQLSKWKHTNIPAMTYGYNENGRMVYSLTGDEEKTPPAKSKEQPEQKPEPEPKPKQDIEETKTNDVSQGKQKEQAKDKKEKEADDNPNIVRVPKYVFNGLDQLARAAHNNRLITMSYGLDGMRLRKDQIYYAYDGKGNLVAELTEDGQIKRIYVWGEREVLAQYEVSKQAWYYYLKNSLRDIIGAADEEGKVVNAYAYDPWGNVLAESEEIHVPFRYRGYYFDKETELYFLNARYYDPRIREFISRDQIEGNLRDPLSLNKFIYCQNNPVGYVDPDGNFVMLAFGIIVGVLTVYDIITDLQEGSVSSLGVTMMCTIGPRLVPGGQYASAIKGAQKIYKHSAQAFRRVKLSEKTRKAVSKVSSINKASQSAFKAAKNTKNFIISNKHLKNAGGRWRKFDTDNKKYINDLIQEGLNSSQAQLLPNSQPGSYKIVTDLGRKLGTKGETKIQTIIGEGGHIWTSYPIK